MKILLAALALVFSLSTANAYTVSNIDTGGNILTYIRLWQNVANSNEQVVIDAPCISACTFFLGFVPDSRVCITSKGSLGLHETNDGKTSDPVFSVAMYRWLYPDWVQQWIKDHGGLQDDPIFMYPEDMKGHIDLCPGNDYNKVSPQELIHQEPTSNVGL